jgi:hypothetical protein
LLPTIAAEKKWRQDLPSDKNKFVSEIEELCRDKNIERIDAVVMWCEKNNLEIETAAYWIKRDATMKSKIQAEAEDLNILKRGARLPV